MAATKLVAHDKDAAREIMQLYMDRLLRSDATSVQGKVASEFVGVRTEAGVVGTTSVCKTNCIIKR